MEDGHHNQPRKYANLFSFFQFELFIPQEPPFVMRAEKTNGAPAVGVNGNLEGYCIDLVEKLSRIVAFEYVVYLTNEYGEINDTSHEWNGMIGQLIRGVSSAVCTQRILIHLLKQFFFSMINTFFKMVS